MRAIWIRFLFNPFRAQDEIGRGYCMYLYRLGRGWTRFVFIFAPDIRHSPPPCDKVWYHCDKRQALTNVFNHTMTTQAEPICSHEPQKGNNPPVQSDPESSGHTDPQRIARQKQIKDTVSENSKQYPPSMKMALCSSPVAILPPSAMKKKNAPEQSKH